MTADQVVDASLQGLKKGQLYVIPGWRYRLLTAVISKLPLRSGWRLNYPEENREWRPN